ncbi:MAG TPA: glycosyltransferase family 4 protein [Pirellulaceae bacterium]|nr:glycosyltransferase family 4 protein [Pirellulaceae bacterium]
MKLVYLTSGAAGMYCGSCMNDNTLARAMIELGHDVQLIPLYTPIRTDDRSVADGHVFFGGINVYLQQKIPLFRYLPRWMDHILDQPWLIRWATGGTASTNATTLGALTVSMLRGSHGFQRKEVKRLVEWLAGHSHPDLFVFSNVLTAGCVPDLKQQFGVPVVVMLQGDDIFLRELPEPFQQEAIAEICQLAEQIDGFLAHSRFYADKMSAYLGIPREKIHVVPLGIDTRDFEGIMVDTAARDSRPPTIGYLARLAPEKGLHVLADAFMLLRQMPGMEKARLRIAGWLGEHRRAYAEDVFAKLRAAGLEEAFEYVGEVDRHGKVEFLKSIDVLSVPTTYEEPKGLFVLEALAAGVPVVVPEHGAFPEMIAELGGGELHRPGDASDLAQRLNQMLSRRSEMTAARRQVLTLRSSRSVGEWTAAALMQFNKKTAPKSTVLGKV